MGVTATGKTDLAISLASRMPVEIISVDSTMVYKGMDLGTGKPDRATLTRVPHGLVDIRSPSRAYSVYEFVQDAWDLVRAINDRGNLALLVGGTMLYFHALREGLAKLPASDARVRAEIEARGRLEGWKQLYKELECLDPRAAAGMAPENAARITRALEVAAITSKPISSWWEAGNLGGWRSEPDVQVEQIVLDHPHRKQHWELLEQRLKSMFERGFVAEVEALRAGNNDLSLKSVSMRAVGYRQIWQGLDKGAKETEMLDAAFAATRRLAKRQRTWLRRRFSEAEHLASNDSRLEEALAQRLSRTLEGEKRA